MGQVSGGVSSQVDIGFELVIASRIRPHVRLSGAGLRLLVEQAQSVSSGAVTAL